MLQRAALLWGMGSIVTVISFWLPFLKVLATSNMSGGWGWREVVVWGYFFTANSLGLPSPNVWATLTWGGGGGWREVVMWGAAANSPT